MSQAFDMKAIARQIFQQTLAGNNLRDLRILLAVPEAS
jgi:hypothetical protein